MTDGRERNAERVGAAWRRVVKGVKEMMGHLPSCTVCTPVRLHPSPSFSSPLPPPSPSPLHHPRFVNIGALLSHGFLPNTDVSEVEGSDIVHRQEHPERLSVLFLQKIETGDAEKDVADRLILIKKRRSEDADSDVADRLILPKKRK